MCSDSKFVQIRKLFKFENCSNSKFVPIRNLFQFKNCSNYKFVQINFMIFIFDCMWSNNTYCKTCIRSERNSANERNKIRTSKFVPGHINGPGPIPDGGVRPLVSLRRESLVHAPCVNSRRNTWTQNTGSWVGRPNSSILWIAVCSTMFFSTSLLFFNSKIFKFEFVQNGKCSNLKLFKFGNVQI
jgi:hypothetical protein